MRVFCYLKFILFCFNNCLLVHKKVGMTMSRYESHFLSHKENSSAARRLSIAARDVACGGVGYIEGRVTQSGTDLVRITGLAHHVRIGSLLEGPVARQDSVLLTVVSVQDREVLAAGPLGTTGLAPGRPARLRITDEQAAPVASELTGGFQISVDESWLGRVVDPLGNPVDGLGQLHARSTARPTLITPIQPTKRAALGEKLATGVRVIDLFTPLRKGQRLGVFAGSGVGKSTLLSMLVQGVECDVVVMGLVGERGREVKEFIDERRDFANLDRTVFVVSTSDSPAIMRTQAVYSAISVAEHFRDQGKSVLLVFDSITRFATAHREIALSAGELPAARGFPPSIFVTLSRILERAGPGTAQEDGSAGYITGIFTVLVDGDDHNDPIADAIRGFLDGHIVLNRHIAEAGRFPPVDILRSVSRGAEKGRASEEQKLISDAKRILAAYDQIRDMVQSGVFKSTDDPHFQRIIRLAPSIENLLQQQKYEFTNYDDTISRIRDIIVNG
jgi:flagellum-specific ATP synthase